MCGIAGSINLPFEPDFVFATLNHRGPDAKNSIRSENVQLLHTRLAILDSIGGAQPMRRGNYLISYNGEIYNHRELRSRHNLVCQTQSDTETLLAMFEKYDVDCLKYLDGMFALAIYDHIRQRLILVRDRAGEKPLFFSRSNRAFCFASEISALGSICRLKADDSAINRFLSCGVFYGSDTAYSNVEECPAGSYLEISTSSLDFKAVRWFELNNTQKPAIDFNDECSVLAEIDVRLKKSVENRLLSSDVEVGAFLSGGIDSGLVTAVASRYTESLKTFTVSFDGQYDESALALSVSKKYGTDHTTLRINYKKLDQNIEKILVNYGEPICDDSVIPTWYVSEAAKQFVSVVLTGDGADELFGGYRRYVPYSHFDLFDSNNRGWNAFNAIHKLMPKPKRKNSYYNYAYRLASIKARTGLDRYFASTTNISTEGLNNVQHSSLLHDLYDCISNTDESGLSKVMAMDFHTLLGGTLLPKMDIGTMAHSLEARSPFLSANMLELAPHLHDRYKIRRNTTKYALRKLAAKYLPEAVQLAPKRGFETSLENLVDFELRTVIHDNLAGGNSYVAQFYKAGYVDNLLAGSSRLSSMERARTLWMMFCVEVWAKKFT